MRVGRKEEIAGVHQRLAGHLVADPRRPAKQVVRDGCLSIVDTEQDTFAFVTDPWLAGFGRAMDVQDLDRCLDGAMKRWAENPCVEGMG